MSRVALRAIGSFVILVVILVGFMVKTQVDGHKELVISPDELKGKTVVFYKDDCPDCKKIMPLLSTYQLSENDFVYVNMNVDGNRHYKRLYHLTEVPTIIKNNKRVEGTNLKKITNLLNNE